MEQNERTLVPNKQLHYRGLFAFNISFRVIDIPRPSGQYHRPDNSDEWQFDNARLVCN